MSKPISVNEMWNNRLSALIRQNKDELFSANKVSKHFKLTTEDASSILRTHLNAGYVEKKDSKKNNPLQCKFKCK